MARERPQSVEEAPPAQMWLLSYGDTMTNLMTFFVLLVTFSSFDNKEFNRMTDSFAKAMPSVGTSKSRSPKDALVPPIDGYEQPKGSEHITEGGTVVGNIKEGREFLEFEDRKIFLIPSDKVFWGRGSLLTEEAADLFKDVTVLIGAIPNRVAISEYALSKDAAADSIGMSRAWAVVSFLCAQKDRPLATDRFAISGTGTVSMEGLPPGVKTGGRILEIAIIDRSVSR